MTILSHIRDMIRDESGATAIEYALILGLITVTIVGAISSLEGAVTNLFNYVSGQVVDSINSVTG